jgi:hypothetical protein
MSLLAELQRRNLLRMAAGWPHAVPVAGSHR